MWRFLSEFPSNRFQVKVVLQLEGGLADRVLFEMMMVAKANAPFVRWFEARTPIGPGADMSAIDWQSLATGN